MDEKLREEAKPLVAIDPDRIMALLLCMGQALWFIQQFEQGLATMLALVFQSSPERTRAEVEAMLEKNERMTSGQLLRELRKHAYVEVRTQELLDEFVDERNWLVDRLCRENGGDIHHADQFQRLLQRVNDVQKRGAHLQAQFGEVTISAMKKRGATDEELNNITLQLLREMREGGLQGPNT